MVWSIGWTLVWTVGWKHYFRHRNLQQSERETSKTWECEFRWVPLNPNKQTKACLDKAGSTCNDAFRNHILSKLEWFGWMKPSPARARTKLVSQEPIEWAHLWHSWVLPVQPQREWELVSLPYWLSGENKRSSCLSTSSRVFGPVSLSVEMGNSDVFWPQASAVKTHPANVPNVCNSCKIFAVVWKYFPFCTCASTEKLVVYVSISGNFFLSRKGKTESPDTAVVFVLFRSKLCATPLPGTWTTAPDLWMPAVFSCWIYWVGAFWAWMGGGNLREWKVVFFFCVVCDWNIFLSPKWSLYIRIWTTHSVCERAGMMEKTWGSLSNRIFWNKTKVKAHKNLGLSTRNF